MVPFPPCGPPLLGCLLAWTLVLAPCFLFSPFIGCFLSTKFGRVSSNLSLWDKRKLLAKTPNEKFGKKISQNSPVFKDLFLGFTNFRQWVLPFRQNMEGFSRFSICLSDLLSNFVKSSSRALPIHLLYRLSGWLVGNRRQKLHLKKIVCLNFAVKKIETSHFFLYLDSPSFEISPQKETLMDRV